MPADFFPNWIGTEQVRAMTLNADLLILRPPAGHRGDAGQTSILTWRREAGSRPRQN